MTLKAVYLGEKSAFIPYKIKAMLRVSKSKKVPLVEVKLRILPLGLVIEALSGEYHQTIFFSDLTKLRKTAIGIDIFHRSVYKLHQIITYDIQKVVEIAEKIATQMQFYLNTYIEVE